MRVGRIQAEENRQRVIDVASRQFREHGFDGIGLKTLMERAGLTQGAFYKQFASKDDLVVQASGRALERARQRWLDAAETRPDNPLAAVVAFYLGMEHRAARMGGCPIVALGSDAARQGMEVKAAFEAGIRDYLEMVGGWMGEADGESSRDASRAKVMAMFATMVGAMVLSRAVNDEQLSEQFLQAAANSVLAASAAHDANGQAAK
jgi:TetR/AcrR family transcriptional repressor of nem operon